MKRLALILLPMLVGCSMMPIGMRRAQEDIRPEPMPASMATTQAKAAPSPSVTAEPKVYPGTGKFVNAPPNRGVAPKGPEEASLNFEAADVREVAKIILGDYLKLSYTIHPTVSGAVTFRTVRPLPLTELLPTLELLLRQNNAAVVVEDGLFKVVPISLVRGSLSPQLGGPGYVIPQGFSVIVVPLRFVGAKEMERILTPFAADNSIRVDEVRNMIILAGTNREIRHLVETIELFDADFLAGYSVGLFQVKSADVKTLVAEFEKVFGAQSPLAGAIRVIPLERLNSLLLVTTQPKYLDTAKTWLERLDQLGGTSGGARFFVYQVRNGKAENLAQLVGDLFSSRRTTTTTPSLAPGARPTTLASTPFATPGTPQLTTTTTVTPAPGAAASAPPTASTFQLPGSAGSTANEVRVIADKDTNSLLILATPTDYDVIESALKKLDTVRRQVLVEVLLAEVQLTDDLQFGIDWFIRSHTTGDGRTTFGTMNTMGALPPNGPILGTDNAVPGFSPGLQLINLSGTQVRAVLRTFGSEGRAQVLASPQIMVLDNEAAELKVGSRISVQTQAQTGISTGTGVLNSFQYLETGILLSVKPRINSGGLVTLEVNQEVSNPTSTPTAVNPNPDISTRNAKTSVIVESGESIVLGGLIRETRSRSSDGIPLLSKIPIVGALFGTQSYNKDRTELVLIITPKIVSDTLQARAVTQEFKSKLPALKDILPANASPAPAPLPADSATPSAPVAAPPQPAVQAPPQAAPSAGAPAAATPPKSP